MKLFKLVILMSHLAGAMVFATVNSQFSLELKVELSLETKISQLVSERLAPNHGFSKEELDAIVSDLSVLASMSGGKSSPLFYEIFSHQKEFNGAWLSRWLLEGIKQLKASNGESCSSEKNYNACSNSSTRTVVLLPAHFQNDRLKRILTLIHERRHLDGYDHIPDTPSYDKEIKGARGAQLAFIISLVNSCSNCTVIAKRNALSYKDEIVETIKNLSEDDRRLFNEELASLKNVMPNDISEFLAEIKQHDSFLTVNHVECKNEVPLYRYEVQHLALPNVDAQDCFYIYYEPKKSPNLGTQFPGGAIHRFGAVFAFVPASQIQSQQAQ